MGRHYVDRDVSKIVFIGHKVSPQALLAQIAERDGMEAVVAVVRVNGCWECCWSSGMDSGGLSMAAIKLLGDTQSWIHGDTSGWSPPQNEEPS